MTNSGMIRYSQMDRVIFGKSCAEALAREVERLDVRRVFLMVSGTLNRETDIISGAVAALGNKFAGLHDNMPAHTPREAVLEATRLARQGDADLIVTIGGGSLTDGAKVVRICLANDVDTVEAMDDYHVNIDREGQVTFPQFAPAVVPQITVPTTLSAGEFNAHAGCTDQRSKVKQGYRHDSIIPTAIIMDPAATVPTPQWLWLSTGIRAVDHAVETLCSTKSNPYCDGMMMHALRLLGSGLRRTKQDPDDLDARLDCQIGAMMSMSGVTGGVPMGASHAIGHILGGTCDVPHGYTSCIMLPAVLRYNAVADTGRQKLVSEALARPGMAADEAVAELIAELGLPHSLNEVGVSADQFDLIAKNSMHDRWLHTNPRKINGEETVIELLRDVA